MVTRNWVRLRHGFFKIRSISLWFMSYYPSNTYIERSFHGKVNPKWLKTGTKLTKLSLSSPNGARAFQLILLSKRPWSRHSELVYSNLHKIQAEVVVWIFSQQKINNAFLGGVLKQALYKLTLIACQRRWYRVSVPILFGTRDRFG